MAGSGTQDAGRTCGASFQAMDQLPPTDPGRTIDWSRTSARIAIEQLMFFRENASLAAPKTTTSSAFAASAPSNPFMFGTSTE